MVAVSLTGVIDEAVTGMPLTVPEKVTSLIASSPAAGPSLPVEKTKFPVLLTVPPLTIASGVVTAPMVGASSRKLRF